MEDAVVSRKDHAGSSVSSSRSVVAPSPLRFAWESPAISYPPPAPGEDVSALGPVSGYFSHVGLQVHGDTFPMTWADDGEIYASSGDPHWGGKPDGLDVECFAGNAPAYRISRVNAMPDYRGNGGEGDKPSGMICVGGVLYLAFQNALGKRPPARGERSQHGSDATIVRSLDHGRSWTPARSAISAPMFPGHAFGGPAFVNVGRNHDGAPDGFVYAVSADQWDNGSHLRTGRVPADRIMDAGAWEWVGLLGGDGPPCWTRDLASATPVLSRERNISLPEMVYVAPLSRYLLLTWCLKGDFSADHGSELFLYEAPSPWGPFALVHHEDPWESPDVNPYCPRLPLKWLSVTSDGIAGWLQFSGSWREQSRHYRSHVRKFRLHVRTP